MNNKLFKLFVISLLLISLLLIPISFADIINPPITTSCTDSDNGLNYYTKGYVVYLTSNTLGTRREDRCLDDKSVIEYACRDGIRIEEVSYNCPNGCKDGACKEEVLAINCKKPDCEGAYMTGKYYDDGCPIYNCPATIEPKHCEDYTYSNCPSNCETKCVPSSCEDGRCTDDCDGPGSCVTPVEIKCPEECACDEKGNIIKCEVPEMPKKLCDKTGGEWIECGSGCGPLRCNQERISDICPAVCILQCKCPSDKPFWDSRFGCIPKDQCEPVSPPISPPIYGGFREAYWQCYDEFEQKERGQCMSAEEWKKIAEKSCSGHCKVVEEGIKKCGVNTFKLDYRCEPSPIEGKYVHLNIPFTLNLKQSAKIADYSLMKITLEDIKWSKEIIRELPATEMSNDVIKSPTPKPIPLGDKVAVVTISMPAPRGPVEIIEEKPIPIEQMPVITEEKEEIKITTRGGPFVILGEAFLDFIRFPSEEIEGAREVEKIEFAEKEVSFIEKKPEYIGPLTITLRLRVRESRRVFGAKLTLLGLAKDSAEFIVQHEVSKCPVGCDCDFEERIIKCPIPPEKCPRGCICEEDKIICEKPPLDKECALGCEIEGKCVLQGTRYNLKEIDSYCDINNAWQEQKEVNERCQNSYECKTNFCSNSRCYDITGEIKETQNILNKIFDWLRNVFR